jgi:murein DD-endopeptidase MepM/ murein hydrolase activator NlpD
MRLFSHNPRKQAIRAALLAALAVPAAAVAAPGEREPADEGSATGTEAVAYLSGIAFGTTTEVEDGPFHPVDGKVDYGSVEAAFGNARGRPHEGQDIFAPTGTPVVSPTATEVLETGADGGRGNWAAVYDRARDRTYNYFHMVAPAEVRAGEKLAPGDPVGQVGCTGSCYGEHLHFEIREGKDPYGTAVDPLPELQRWEPVGR